MPESYLELARSDLMEIVRALVNMKEQFSNTSSTKYLVGPSDEAIKAVLTLALESEKEIKKYLPSLEDETEKSDKPQKKEKKIKEEILSKEKEQGEGYIPPPRHRSPGVLSPIKELKKKESHLSQKTESNMNIEALIALADKLDAAGEGEKANQIDEMVKKMAIEPTDPKPGYIAPWESGEEISGDQKSYFDDPEYKKFVKEQDKIQEEADLLENSAVRSLDVAVEMIKAATNAAISNSIQLFGSKEINNLTAAAYAFYNYIEEQIKRSKLSDAEGSNKLSDTFQKFAEIADKLDAMGATEEANLIDEFIAKNAELLKTEAKKEKIDPYDSKAHHSEQIREPKESKKPIEKHHVQSYQETGTGHLSTRYCPKHIGVTMGRIGENTYQCPIDNEIFNWETGYTDENGVAVPGGSVAGQTPESTEYAIPSRVFDSREKVLNVIN